MQREPSITTEKKESTDNSTKTISEPSTPTLGQAEKSPEEAMWDMIIKKYGQNQFQAVYFVLNTKYKKNRFQESFEKKIAEDVNSALSPLGMTDPEKQKELIGLVSSFMIMEEYKEQMTTK